MLSIVLSLDGDQDNGVNHVDGDHARISTAQNGPGPDSRPRPAHHSLPASAPRNSMPPKASPAPLLVAPTAIYPQEQTHVRSPGSISVGAAVWQVALEWENKWFGGPLAGLSEHNNAAMEDLAEQLGHRWDCEPPFQDRRLGPDSRVFCWGASYYGRP